MVKVNKLIIIFFFVCIQFCGCEKWILIWSKPKYNDYYFDKNSITYLEDGSSFEVTTKMVYFNNPRFPPNEDLLVDYALDKIIIKCKTGEMKSIGGIVYYSDGTNSSWHNDEDHFFIPKSKEVTQERDFICAHK